MALVFLTVISPPLIFLLLSLHHSFFFTISSHIQLHNRIPQWNKLVSIRGKNTCWYLANKYLLVVTYLHYFSNLLQPTIIFCWQWNKHVPVHKYLLVVLYLYYFSNFMYMLVSNTLVSVIQVLIYIVVYQCLLSADVILLEHVCSYLCTMMQMLHINQFTHHSMHKIN